MKTPSGTFTLVALAAIAIGSILTFRLFAQSSTTPSPTPSPLKYLLQIDGGPLPVKDVEKFKQLLKDSTGMASGVNYATPTPTPTSGATPGLTRAGVNVTQRVTTNSDADFLKLLESFGTPTPSPTATPRATP